MSRDDNDLLDDLSYNQMVDEIMEDINSDDDRFSDDDFSFDADLKSSLNASNDLIKELDNELGPEYNVKEKIAILQSSNDEVSEALTEALANNDLSKIKDILSSNETRFNNEFLDTDEKDIIEEIKDKEKKDDDISIVFSPEIEEFHMLLKDPIDIVPTSDLFCGSDPLSLKMPHDGTYFTVNGDKFDASSGDSFKLSIAAAEKLAREEINSTLSGRILLNVTPEQDKCFAKMLNDKALSNDEVVKDIQTSLQEIGAKKSDRIGATTKDHLYIDFAVYEKELDTGEKQYLIHAYPNMDELAYDYREALIKKNLLTPDLDKTLSFFI